MQPTKTAILYKGKVIIDFFGEGAFHYYKKRGTKDTIVSVTSAVGIVDKSSALIWWAIGLMKEKLHENLEFLVKSKDGTAIAEKIEEAGKQHQIKKEEAADLGTQVHDWVDRYTNASKKEKAEMVKTENLKNLDERVVNGISAFLRWIKKQKVEFLENEKLVYSNKYDYVGLLDAKAKINGKLALVDYKTSKGVYSTYRYQTAAYLKADEEESGVKYDERWILKFGKDDGEFEAYKLESLEEDFETFIACLVVKKREKFLALKANQLFPIEF